MELLANKTVEIREATSCSLVLSSEQTQEEDSEDEQSLSRQKNDPSSGIELNPKDSSEEVNEKQPTVVTTASDYSSHRYWQPRLGFTESSSDIGYEEECEEITPPSSVVQDTGKEKSKFVHWDQRQTDDPKSCEWHEYENRRQMEIMRLQYTHKPSKKKKKQGKTIESPLSQGNNCQSITTDDPFDMNYELWEARHDKTKVRVGKHRKCSKIRALHKGEVVKCLEKRQYNSKRFKIEYPVIGWCSFLRSSRSGTKSSKPAVSSTGSPSANEAFRKVDPHQLPVVDSRFVLELKLGQGSFGKVFVAWDMKRKKKVAVKINFLKFGEEKDKAAMIAPYKEIEKASSRDSRGSKVASCKETGEKASSRDSKGGRASFASKKERGEKASSGDSKGGRASFASKKETGEKASSRDSKGGRASFASYKETGEKASSWDSKGGRSSCLDTKGTRPSGASFKTSRSAPIKDETLSRSFAELISHEGENEEEEEKRLTEEATNLDTLRDTWRDRVFKKEIQIMRKLVDCYCVPSYVHSGIIRTHTNDDKDLDGDRDGSYVGMQYMVTNLQGLSLSLLKKNYLKKFSLKTVMMLGVEFVQILRAIHKCGVLHRDVKPANFVVSRAHKGQRIYVLDFGLSVMYLRGDKTHIEYRDNCRRCGTARYSSINTHKRQRQSRRDDLEAAGYVLVLFLQDLPWKQRKAESPELKWSRILKEKLRWNPRKLCCGLPSQVGEVFYEYFEYCRNLAFSEKPDYKYLKDLFAKTLEKNNEILDYKYDWLDIL